MSRTKLRAQAVVYHEEPRQDSDLSAFPLCSFPNHRAFAELCHSSPAAPLALTSPTHAIGVLRNNLPLAVYLSAGARLALYLCAAARPEGWPRGKDQTPLRPAVRAVKARAHERCGTNRPVGAGLHWAVAGAGGACGISTCLESHLTEIARSSSVMVVHL
eukprot:scaffold90135_cov69-Phaeocystis_antarctica.AAC.1